MRAVRQNERYPKLCRTFETIDEMSIAINKSRGYIQERLHGRAEFTHKDKLAALRYLGESPDGMEEFFPGDNCIGTSAKNPKEDLVEISPDIDPSLELVERLKDLSRLYQDGFLTESEFMKVKKRIIG